MVIGGGLGTAIAYPQAKRLHELGAQVDVITGFRNQQLVILEDELKACSDRLIVMTDDGSNGNKGFVTHALQKLLDEGNQYDVVIAIGPMMMMKFVDVYKRQPCINVHFKNRLSEECDIDFGGYGIVDSSTMLFLIR